MVDTAPITPCAWENPPTILLVENDYIQRAELQNTLSRDQCTVVVAYNVEDAIRRLKEQPVDLVLTEMCMRRATGLDLLNYIRSNEQYLDVPVILISAFDDERALALALEAGASDYISKPYASAVLRARVHTAIRNGLAVRKARERAQALAGLVEQDELTGVRNRRHLMNALQSEMARAERYRFPLSVLLLDIDHFKAINDTYGHDVGDKVLSLFAQTVKETMRTVDELCRLGGEEFCAVLLLTELDDAVIMAERIRHVVEQHEISIGEHVNIHITVSIGVATWRQSHGHSPPNLLRRADAALYRAKAEGRNQVVCFASTDKTPI